MAELIYLGSLVRLVLGIIASIILIISRMKGFDIKTLENRRKRYNYFKEIIMNSDNKVLSYTCLKEYLGFSISDNMIEYIINSTKFHEIVTRLKSSYAYVEFDATTKKFSYKNNQKPRIAKYFILYFITLIPLLILITFLNQLLGSYVCLVVVIIFAIPATAGSIRCLSEVADRTSAIKLLKELENE